jgi:hypothetical protein
MARRRRRRAANPWAGYKLPAPKKMNVTYGDFTYPGPEAAIVGGYADPATGDVHSISPDDFSTGHEAFHLLDLQTATDADRARWESILGLSGPWNQGTGLTGGGLRSPSEIIADNYGMLVSGTDPRHAMQSSYADHYDFRRMRRFARSLERFRRRNGLGVYDARAIRREALRRMAG